MITAKCIQKFRDKNNIIYGYRLQDQQNNLLDMRPNELKQRIKLKQLNIINLTLTKDNRLIDTTEDKNTSQYDPYSPENIELTFKKFKLLGKKPDNIKEIPTCCEHKCYLIIHSDKSYTIYIPDDVTILNKDYSILTCTEHIQNIQGKVRVIGGKNLVDVNYMFLKCKAQSIDLSSFNTSKVESMHCIFYECKAHSINLSSFNTSNVKNMHAMFKWCEAQSINLSSFDTSNVENMSYMFYGCKAQSLDLSSFNTSKVEDMSFMFSGCQAQSLDLSSFDTSSVENMYEMFYECQAQSLDLSSFDTSNVLDMAYMFYKCEAKSINLSSFDISNVLNMREMFKGCQAQLLDLSSFDTSNVEFMRGMFAECNAQVKASDKRILKTLKER